MASRVGGRSRRAAEIVHRDALADARAQARLAVAACAVTIAAWGVRGAWRPGSALFLPVGLALAWAVSAVRRWRALRALAPDDFLARRGLPPEPALDDPVAWPALARRRPLLTGALLAAIGAVFAVQAVVGIDRSIVGAGIVKPLVTAGERWRLATGPLLHGNLVHLLLNGLALLFLGRLGEAYGPRSRLAIACALSLAGGAIATWRLEPRASVGASGMICGMAAYLWVLARRAPGDVPAPLARTMVVTLAATAYLGLFGMRFVDNAAHAGGTLAGAAAALVLVPRAGRARSARARALEDVAGGVATAALLASAAVAVRALLRVAPG